MANTTDNLPGENERICLVSFEIARIRVGGGPAERQGFWAAYREALDVNRRTHYQNDRIRICRPFLAKLQFDPKEPVYWRAGRLVRERGIACDSSKPERSLSS